MLAARYLGYALSLMSILYVSAFFWRFDVISSPVRDNDHGWLGPVIRGDKHIKVKVRPGEVPDDSTPVVNRRKAREAPEPEFLGIKVQALTTDLAKQFEVDLTEGVIVSEVESGSVAEQKGIRPGEIITDLNRHKVTNVREFKEALKAADPKKGILVNLIGEGGRRFEVLKDSGD